MIWSLDFDLFEGRNWEVNWHVEGIGVEFAVGDTFDFAILFAI